jgi:hypothetical protein
MEVLGHEEVKVDGKVHLLYTVQVTGETPRLNGWEFVARIEHAEAGNIIRAFSEVPERFRDVEPWCEHCQKIRQRKDTFVIEKDGEYKQVGRSCLRDFLGHKDPQTVASFAEWLKQAQDMAEKFYDDFDLNASPDGFDTIRYLATVNSVIRANGWMSKSKAYGIEAPTSEIAISLLLDRKADYTEKDVELAKQVVEWANTVLSEKERLNDYEHNLVVVLSQEWVSFQNTGFAASAIVAYQRWVEEQTSLEAQNYIGTVGKREEFELTVISVRYLDSEWGVSKLHKMVDKDGNIVVWFSSSKELEEGKTYKGKATVKKHSEYRGEKQTQINRFSAKEV